jgi:hypothetical protein
LAGKSVADLEKPARYIRAGFMTGSGTPGTAAAQIHRVQNPPQLVEAVRQGPDGMAPDHARSRIAHDPANFLALSFLVAMNGAVGASGLGLAIRAFLQAAFGVTHQIITLIAQLAVTVLVVIPTVDDCHASQYCMLAFQPARQCFHVLKTNRPEI